MGYSTPFAIPITLIPHRRRRKLDDGAASEVLGRRLSTCNNDCATSGDDDCDDGGAGAEYGDCDFGSDCDDCGVRTGDAPTAAPTWAPTEAPTPAIDACSDHHPHMTDAGSFAWLGKVYELPQGVFEARIAYVGYPTATDYSPLVTEVTQKLTIPTLIGVLGGTIGMFT